jgi:hypothetical protein
MVDRDETDNNETDNSCSYAIRDITLEEARRRYDDEGTPGTVSKARLER